MTTRPPTTPPTMAPMGVLLELPPLLPLLPLPPLPPFPPFPPFPPVLPPGVDGTFGLINAGPLQAFVTVLKLLKVEAPLLALPNVMIWLPMGEAVIMDEKVGTFPGMLTRCSLDEVPGVIEYKRVDPSDAYWNGSFRTVWLILVALRPAIERVFLTLSKI